MRNGKNPSARSSLGQAKGYAGKKTTSPSTSPGLPPLPRIPQAPGSASGVSKAYNPYQHVPFGGHRQMPKRSSSLNALPRFPSAAKQLRLPPLRKGSGGSEPSRERTDEMASSDPGNPCSSSEDGAPETLMVSPAAVVDLARSAEEILQVGPWSVRRLHGESGLGLVFLNVEEERVELQPPLEVLEALDIAQDQSESESSTVPHESTENDKAETADEQQEPFPLFRRIILGAKTEVPLKMARDILDAIKEDVSMFEQLQKRFSDAPEEPPLSLQEGLGEEVEEFAMSLRPGEVSDVIGTADGIQIILRLQ